jgi:hypothetical protein
MIADRLFLAGLGTSFVLMVGGRFVVNRREALSMFGRSVLGFVLLMIGVLGLRALGITEGTLFYPELFMIVFLVAVVTALLQLRGGGDR